MTSMFCPLPIASFASINKVCDKTIEATNLIRKGLLTPGLSSFAQFAALAA